MAVLFLRRSIRIALIDDVDVEAAIMFRWYLEPARLGKTDYAATKIGAKTVRLHQFIGSQMGLSRDLEIDHENRNGLDCQRSNLRSASGTQNQANTALRNDNKSGFKGVHWHTKSKKWRASIRENNKPRMLGYFDDPSDGARLYDKHAKRLFGNFAYLNFPQNQQEERT